MTKDWLHLHPPRNCLRLSNQMTVNQGRVLLAATVIDVGDGPFMYLACQQCYSKVTLQGGRLYQCHKCRMVYNQQEEIFRYHLRLTISDSTSVANVSSFGAVLNTFFGLSASEFHNRYVIAIQDKYGAASRSIILVGLQQAFLAQNLIFGLKVPVLSSWRDEGRQGHRVHLKDICPSLNSQCLSGSTRNEFVAVQVLPQSESSFPATVAECLQQLLSVIEAYRLTPEFCSNKDALLQFFIAASRREAETGPPVNTFKETVSLLASPVFDLTQSSASRLSAIEFSCDSSLTQSGQLNYSVVSALDHSSCESTQDFTTRKCDRTDLENQDLSAIRHQCSHSQSQNCSTPNRQCPECQDLSNLRHLCNDSDSQNIFNHRQQILDIPTLFSNKNDKSCELNTRLDCSFNQCDNSTQTYLSNKEEERNMGNKALSEMPLSFEKVKNAGINPSANKKRLLNELNNRKNQSLNTWLNCIWQSPNGCSIRRLKRISECEVNQEAGVRLCNSVMKVNRPTSCYCWKNRSQPGKRNSIKTQTFKLGAAPIRPGLARVLRADAVAHRHTATLTSSEKIYRNKHSSPNCKYVCAIKTDLSKKDNETCEHDVSRLSGNSEHILKMCNSQKEQPTQSSRTLILSDVSRRESSRRHQSIGEQGQSCVPLADRTNVSECWSSEILTQVGQPNFDGDAFYWSDCAMSRSDILKYDKLSRPGYKSSAGCNQEKTLNDNHITNQIDVIDYPESEGFEKFVTNLSCYKLLKVSGNKSEEKADKDSGLECCVISGEAQKNGNEQAKCDDSIRGHDCENIRCDQELVNGNEVTGDFPESEGLSAFLSQLDQTFADSAEDKRSNSFRESGPTELVSPDMGVKNTLADLLNRQGRSVDKMTGKLDVTDDEQTKSDDLDKLNDKVSTGLHVVASSVLRNAGVSSVLEEDLSKTGHASQACLKNYSDQLSHEISLESSSAYVPHPQQGDTSTSPDLGLSSSQKLGSAGTHLFTEEHPGRLKEAPSCTDSEVQTPVCHLNVVETSSPPLHHLNQCRKRLRFLTAEQLRKPATPSFYGDSPVLLPVLNRRLYVIPYLPVLSAINTCTSRTTLHQVEDSRVEDSPPVQLAQIESCRVPAIQERDVQCVKGIPIQLIPEYHCVTPVSENFKTSVKAVNVVSLAKSSLKTGSSGWISPVFVDNCRNIESMENEVIEIVNGANVSLAVQNIGEEGRALLQQGLRLNSSEAIMHGLKNVAEARCQGGSCVGLTDLDDSGSIRSTTENSEEVFCDSLQDLFSSGETDLETSPYAISSLVSIKHFRNEETEKVCLQQKPAAESAGNLYNGQPFWGQERLAGREKFRKSVRFAERLEEHMFHHSDIISSLPLELSTVRILKSILKMNEADQSFLCSQDLFTDSNEDLSLVDNSLDTLSPSVGLNSSGDLFLESPLEPVSLDSVLSNHGSQVSCVRIDKNVENVVNHDIPVNYFSGKSSFNEDHECQNLTPENINNKLNHFHHWQLPVNDLAGDAGVTPDLFF